MNDCSLLEDIFPLQGCQPNFEGVGSTVVDEDVAEVGWAGKYCENNVVMAELDCSPQQVI